MINVMYCTGVSPQQLATVATPRIRHPNKRSLMNHYVIHMAAHDSFYYVAKVLPSVAKVLPSVANVLPSGANVLPSGAQLLL